MLGNHVIRNARALVLGGAAFGSTAMLERGVAAARARAARPGAPGRRPLRAQPRLPPRRPARPARGRGRGRRPRPRRRDRADARLRGRPRPARRRTRALQRRRARSCAARSTCPSAGTGSRVFAETGYAVLRTPRIWLAFDCGPPSPPYLPAHAHADALSFQLWVDGSPVVVDPGTFTYEPGAQRDWFRGTRAHSTVAVDGDQFELWGAFRSGPLPRVELLEASEQELAAAVTGRSGRAARAQVRLDGRELTIVDRLEGGGSRLVESSLPLAPGARAGGERHRVRAGQAGAAPALGAVLRARRRGCARRARGADAAGRARLDDRPGLSSGLSSRDALARHAVRLEAAPPDPAARGRRAGRAEACASCSSRSTSRPRSARRSRGCRHSPSTWPHAATR